MNNDSINIRLETRHLFIYSRSYTYLLRTLQCEVLCYTAEAASILKGPWISKII